MSLDFNDIRQQAKISKKEKDVLNITSSDEIRELSDIEKKQLDFYIREVEQHITEYAKDGKFKFFYDCSKLKTHMFFAIARKFKDEKSKFYVETHAGIQRITIDWTGKHEV